MKTMMGFLVLTLIVSACGKDTPQQTESVTKCGSEVTVSVLNGGSASEALIVQAIPAGDFEKVCDVSSGSPVWRGLYVSTAQPSCGFVVGDALQHSNNANIQVNQLFDTANQERTIPVPLSSQNLAVCN